jgi:hypothetical protein
LKFLGEVWARQACIVANEVELTKVPKSGGRRKKKGGGCKNKMGLACGRRVIIGRRPAVGLHQCFQIIIFLIYFYFLSYEDLPSILGEWMYNTSIF